MQVGNVAQTIDSQRVKIAILYYSDEPDNYDV